MPNGFLCSLTQYHSATAGRVGRSFFAAVQRPACGKDKEDAAIQELSTCVTRDPELQPPTLTQSREPRAPLVLWFFGSLFFGSL